MIYPKQIKTRKKIEALTGIKSSLDKIRSVIALVYLLYIANGRKAFVKYSIQEGSKIKIAPDILNAIESFLGRNNLEDVINDNPLITNQYEPLYVGVTLLMKLGYLKMEGRQNTAERKGGVRYPKQLYFANNTLVLDLILQGIPEDIRKQSIYEWLQNSIASNNEFEERVCKFLTTCTFLTQFKLRDNSNSELFFQTEGIYKALTESDEEVLYSDSHEFVGPTRIYNNVLKEGIEPWIGVNRNVLNLKGNVNPDAESICQMLSTTLDIFNVKDDSSMSEEDSEDNNEEKQNKDYPLQQIYYGAPGTGKSHEVKKQTGELFDDSEDRDLPNVFRTTFHPDTDYASFVGCYKPSMRKTGKKHQVDGNDVDDEEIIYEFVPQTFTDAYVYSYKNPTEPTYLVIEEINRGNCAQIFGDLFQLLDRKNGVSEYRIKADKDLAKFLSNELGEDADGIKDGKLRLPRNLNILATMNTSDQSLFPIDSAFKRRWEWKYTPIAQGKDKQGNLMKWKIEGQGENSWWTFIQGINEVIDVTTHSEDKKLGFFFCKDQDGVISKETFVNKVVFYLWNDVFKVYGFKSEIFDKKGKGDKTEKITFKSFYKDDGFVNEETMSVFVKNVMAKAPKENSNDITNESEEITEGSEAEA